MTNSIPFGVLNHGRLVQGIPRVRRGQASLAQQIERLTEAYLAGIVLIDEYRRRKNDLEQRQHQLEEQARQLDAHTDRQKELAGLSRFVETFCRRIQQGLAHASFEQRRSLIELLIDRVIVTDGEVEIRYVVPTAPSSEQVRFCHLRLDYRAGPSQHQGADPMYARLREPRRRSPLLQGARRTSRSPPSSSLSQPDYLCRFQFLKGAQVALGIIRMRDLARSYEEKLKRWCEC